jgi:Family of unknown function (DUF6627)
MFRLIRGYRSVFIVMTFLAFLIAIPIEHACAALVYTQISETEPHSDHSRTRMNNLLAREDVRAVLLQHGINPAEVEARMAVLTDDEVTQIRDRIGELPAGGMAPIAYPLWFVVLGIAAYILVITGVISLGAYAGTKLKDQAEEEYAKSTPYPAPARVGPLPIVNPNEPWTGKWKVSEGQFRGLYSLQQNGDKVVSTSDSDQVVDAKVHGAMIWGRLGGKQDFKATIASDFLSFKGNVDTRYPAEGLRVELAESKVQPTEIKVNPSEPWTGKWKVTDARHLGTWALKQTGDEVVSTSASDYVVEAKVHGSTITGFWYDKSRSISRGEIKATIAEDGLSFQAITYPSRAFTGKKTE